MPDCLEAFQPDSQGATQAAVAAFQTDAEFAAALHREAERVRRLARRLERSRGRAGRAV